MTKNDIVQLKAINNLNDQNSTMKCCSCNKKLNDLFQHDFNNDEDEIFICDICDYSWNSGSYVDSNLEFISDNEKDIIKSKYFKEFVIL